MTLHASLVDVGTSVTTYAELADVVISYAGLVEEGISDMYMYSWSWEVGL